jgi:hypothetical protein
MENKLSTLEERIDSLLAHFEGADAEPEEASKAK